MCGLEFLHHSHGLRDDLLCRVPPGVDECEVGTGVQVEHGFAQVHYLESWGDDQFREPCSGRTVRT